MDMQRQPRWNKWRLMPEVRAWEAVALSMNIEPEKARTNKYAWMGAEHPFDEGDEFNDRLSVLLANLADRASFPTPCTLNLGDGYKNGVRLTEFAAWAKSIAHWEMPPEMVELAEADDTKQPIPDPSAKAAQVVNKPTSSKPGNDWKEECRKIADELDAQDAKAGAWSSNDDMSGRVAREAIKRCITGPNGQLTAANILREALQGGRWTRKRSKPTE